MKGSSPAALCSISSIGPPNDRKRRCRSPYSRITVGQQRDQQRNRSLLSVEPHAHHRPVEDQPDDRLIGEQTAIPTAPTPPCPPNPADRVLPRGAAAACWSPAK